MKRTFAILAAFFVSFLWMREMGFVGLNAYRSKAETMIASSDAMVPSLNATHIRFEEDNGKPFLPRPTTIENTYHVVVRYRLCEDLAWNRWLPLYKTGKNKLQLFYNVWEGSSLMGCGYVNVDCRQTVFGLCSAHEYRNKIVAPMLEKMHKSADEKIHLFSYHAQTASPDGKRSLP